MAEPRLLPHAIDDDYVINEDDSRADLLIRMDTAEVGLFKCQESILVLTEQINQLRDHRMQCCSIL